MSYSDFSNRNKSSIHTLEMTLLISLTEPVYLHNLLSAS